MKRAVLVVTRAGDVSADAVISVLDARGVPVFRFHPDEFPESVQISLEIDGGRCRGSIDKPGRSVRLEEIAVGWYRKPLAPVAVSETDPAIAAYTVQQSRRLLSALYATLDVHWVGGALHDLHRAESKPLQLIRAHAAGLNVPPTIHGNARSATERFRKRWLPGPLAVKTFLPDPVQRADGTCLYPLTAVLDASAPLDGIELAPSILQPYVEKRFELRVVVVGERVLCARILSQDDARTMTDWRADDCAVESYELPDEIAARMRELVAGLGLCFASSDLIVTPDGEYVFLDLNPSGEWWWLEAQAGLPISDAIADLMCSRLEELAAAA